MKTHKEMQKEYFRRIDALNSTSYNRGEQENLENNILEDLQGSAEQSNGPRVAPHANQAMSLDYHILDDAQFEHFQNDQKFKEFSKTKVNELGSLGTLKNLSKILNSQQEFHLQRQTVNAASGRNGQQPSQSQPSYVKQISNGKIVSQKQKENMNELLKGVDRVKSTSQLMKRKQVLQNDNVLQHDNSQIEIKQDGYRQILKSRERLDKLEQMNQSLLNLLNKQQMRCGKKSAHQAKQSQTIDWNVNPQNQNVEKFDQSSLQNQGINNKQDKILSVTMGPEGFRQCSRDGKQNHSKSRMDKVDKLIKKNLKKQKEKDMMKQYEIQIKNQKEMNRKRDLQIQNNMVRQLNKEKFDMSQRKLNLDSKNNEQMQYLKLQQQPESVQPNSKHFKNLLSSKQKSSHAQSMS